jgi:hypothetical protein
MKPARKRAQAIAAGRGRDQRVVVPLAFATAARIAARPLDEFRVDPTQLANGLAELQRAIAADGIVVALAGGMERASCAGPLDAAAIVTGGPVAASLEATSRLRQTFADQVALVAGLTGPSTLAHQFDTPIAAAAACFAALTKAFCAAGADCVLVFEEPGLVEDADWQAALKTAGNIARFHQASLLCWSSATLPVPVKLPLDAPSTTGTGYITTDREVAEDADLVALAAWVRATRGEV